MTAETTDRVAARSTRPGTTRSPGAAPGRAAREVLRETLTRQRRGLAAWCAVLAGLTLLYSALWPSVRAQPGLVAVMRGMPAVLRSLLSTTDISTPAGYVQAELLGLTGPLLVVACAVLAGARGIAGEEEAGRLGLLLALPVTRTGVVLARAAAMAAGTVVVTAATGTVLALAGVAGGPSLPVGGVAAAMVHLALLGVVFGTLALAVGAVTGSLAAARGVPAVLAVLGYVLNGIAPLVGWPSWVAALSPFHQYAAARPLRHGISLPGAAVAVGTVAVLLAVAVAGFGRRDVGP